MRKTLLGILLGAILFGGGSLAYATSAFPVAIGGTGLISVATSTLIFGNGTSPFSSVTAGTNGQILVQLNGIPRWATASSSAATASWPFTPTTNYGVPVQSTSTPIWDTAGFMASSTSYFVNTTATLATTTQATTTAFAITSIASTLLNTNATGGVVPYGGTSCTNQFIRSLNGAGAATCATVQNTDLANSSVTLNTTAPITGGGAVSLGGSLTFACATCITALADPFTHVSVYGQTTSATSTLLSLTGSPFSLVASSTVNFVNASTTNMTIFSTGHLQLNGITSGILSTDSIGQVLSTTLSSGFSLAANALSNVSQASFTYSTSTAWTGTTTIMLEQPILAVTYNAVSCFSPVGTLNFQIGNGTASTTMFNASSTNNINNYTSNNAMAIGNKVRVDIGTPASSPTTINCTVKKTI